MPLAIDVHEDDQAYTVTIELPGVQQENIDVKLEGDYLLIEGKLPEEVVEIEGRRTLVQERRCRKFQPCHSLTPDGRRKQVRSEI